MQFLERTVTYKKPFDVIVGYFTQTKKVETKLLSLGARNVTIHPTLSTPSEVRWTIQREVRAEAPRPLNKFIKPWNQVTQSEHWHLSLREGVVRGDIEINIHGVPAGITSHFRLEPKDKGCIAIYDSKISSQIPVAGRLLETFIHKDALSFIDQEKQFLEQTH